MATEQFVRANLEEAQSALKALLADGKTIEAISKRPASLLAWADILKTVGVCSRWCPAMAARCAMPCILPRSFPAVFVKTAPVCLRPRLASRDISPALPTILVMSLYSRAISRHMRGRAIACLPSAPAKCKSKRNRIITAAEACKENLRREGDWPDGEGGFTARPTLRHHHRHALAAQYADRVQELHIKTIHIMIELVER